MTSTDPMRLAMLAACTIACTACGAGPDRTLVRPRAAYELNCPDDQLELRQVSGSTFAVTGCGARATYTCMGGMGQYACSREGEVQGRSGTPTPPAGANDVTSAARPVSDEVLPRSRAHLGCDAVRIYEIARLTYAAHGCGSEALFVCAGGGGQYRCQME